MTDVPIDNVIPLADGTSRFSDSFVNFLAGLGVPGRDKFASQQYTHAPLSVAELEAAYRSDWIARKVVTIPAWDMTREWRSWQADPDQIQLLEEVEKKLFVQQKLQQALIKSRLYGGAVIVIGVDAGAPEEELDPEMVTQDSLKFLHVVSRNNVSTGPIIRDITSKYFGQPEYYEARQEPVSKSFQQAEANTNPDLAKNQMRLHPSRVVKLIGMDTADQMLSDTWGDSVLQAVSDAVKMCGLVTGSIATMIAELKIDVIKIPELKSILSTKAGEAKMIQRFQAANAAKSIINTILIDGNEEWQRMESSLRGAPEVLMAYMQIASGAADIPATRFLGSAPKGLNATGDSDTRNYYDRLAAEQSTILTPSMNILDEVLIRSALGDKPPEVWYTWDSLWQLTDTEKADVALKKAQTFQIDVTAALIPTTALANARANQLIEDGTYPGLEKALEEAALEGDTIEEHNAPTSPINGMDPMADPNMVANMGKPPPGQPGGPPAGPQPPFGAKPGAPPQLKVVVGGDSLADFNEKHEKETGQFAEKGGGGSGSGGQSKEVDPNKPLDPSKSDNLSTDEKKSLERYQSKNGFKKINKPLREGKEPSADAKNLSSAIDKHKLDKDATVFRGMGDTLSKQLQDAWDKKKPGEDVTFSDKGFLSTSRSKGAAATFSNQMLEMKIPKGHSALPMANAKGMGGEAEILLNRDTKFKVTGVSPGVTKGSKLFKVELLS